MAHPSESKHRRRARGPVLGIHLLGQPQVEWAGKPLGIERRQVRALLYRLAAEPRSVPREKLCYLFWPDIPETSARRNLRVRLAHLRRALPAPDLVQTAGDLVGLDPERTWSDTIVFERLQSGQMASASIGRLQQAADLYRGPFLAGFSLPGCSD